MATWQENTKIEKWELDDKIHRLAGLLRRYKKGDNGCDVATEQLPLLEDQLTIMSDYSMVLWRRVLADARQYRVPVTRRVLLTAGQVKTPPAWLPRLVEFASSNTMYNYMGVLVVNDDDRVLDIVEGLPDVWRRELLAVHGHEGTVSFLWKRPAPQHAAQYVYVEGEQFNMPDSDVWTVYSVATV